MAAYLKFMTMGSLQRFKIQEHITITILLSALVVDQTRKSAAQEG